MRYRVLIVGLGQVSVGYDLYSKDNSSIYTHAKAFSTHQHFELVCGVDPDQVACERFSSHYDIASERDLSVALGKHDPHVVVVASPTSNHADAIKIITTRSKVQLVLCEKPIASNLTDACNIIEWCKRSNTLLYVNYLRRVCPSTLRVKDLMKDGTIETPLKGTAWYTRGLIHNGSHFFNLLEFWLGPMKDFKIVTRKGLANSSDIEPDVLVQFDSSSVLFLASGVGNIAHHEMQLIGPTGRLSYLNGGEKTLWQRSKGHSSFPGYRMLDPDAKLLGGHGGSLQFRVVEEVYRCLQGHDSSLCSGEDATETLESLLKIKEAHG